MARKQGGKPGSGGSSSGGSGSGGSGSGAGHSGGSGGGHAGGSGGGSGGGHAGGSGGGSGGSKFRGKAGGQQGSKLSPIYGTDFPFNRPEPANKARIGVEFDEPTLLGPLFGQFDKNLVAIENRLGVYIAARGNRIQIEGEAEAAARARDVLVGLHKRIEQGLDIDEGAVEALITMSAEPTLEGIVRSEVAEPPAVMIRTRKKTIVPRSAMQTEYMEALVRDDIIFALGPAGTGKTYLAVAQAVSQLITGSVNRLILSRPAVEAGERLGFLPGDMKEKVDPYLRPLYDALYDTLPAEQVERRIASGEIEIAPLAFMRGRTLADSFIILDEAQNTTPAQMKMFLTRFGMNSRMVICGDPKQVDLPGGVGASGLADAVGKLEGVQGMGTVRFTAADVVRHPIVGRIVEAYEGKDT